MQTEQNKTVNAAICCIDTLNKLAKMAARGFFPFSMCRMENHADWDDAVVYLDDASDAPCGMRQYDIIADSLVDKYHHDAVTGWAEILSEFCGGRVTARVKLDTSGQRQHYISIENVDAGTEIIVEGGEWYVA